MIIGIDEAGRGPLAGPVSVGVACTIADFDWGQIEGVHDSKKLTEVKREAIYERAKELQKMGILDFAVVMVSAKVIDEIGIVPSVNRAMEKALVRLSLVPGDCMIKLDGGLKAPQEYIHQETIIKGDAKEKVIGLASIVAKVTRDRYMVQQSDKAAFLPYNFAKHKGYGTKAHREVIKEIGLSEIHRVSFCRNLL